MNYFRDNNHGLVPDHPLDVKLSSAVSIILVILHKNEHLVPLAKDVRLATILDGYHILD